MSPSLAYATLALTPLAAPQESRALLDAPLVEVDSLNRIEHLVEWDGTEGYEAVAWWWWGKPEKNFDVRGWDIDPVQGFSELWVISLDNPSGQSSLDPLLVPADVDGAGERDLIVINDGMARVFVHAGPGAPQLVQSLTLPGEAWTAHAVDVDGDGDDDLLTIEKSTFLAQYYENDGTYTAVGTPLALGTGAYRYCTGELTGDGVPDLLYTRFDGIVIQPLASDFTFPPEIAYPLTSPPLSPHLTIGDIDGDGDDDAVIFTNGPAPSYIPQYAVLRRDGPGTLTREANLPGGPATHLVDLDGDGDLDGACCGGTGGGGSNDPEPSVRAWENRSGSKFEICHNDGTGAFTLSTSMPGLGASRLAGAVDVDFDGDVDLVAGRVVYYAPEPITDPFVEGQLYGFQLHRNLLTDCDDDGDPDVNFTLEEVKRSDGTLHLDPAVPTLAPPVNGLSFTGPGYAGDFDGDGDDDLLVAKWKSGTFRKMRFLKNAGGGHLIDAGDASDPGVSFGIYGPSTISPTRSWPVDWNQDGDLDLVTWGSIGTNPQTSLWDNDGAGYFLQTTPFTGFGSYVPHGFADFNGDTFTDLLAVYGDEDRKLHVFLGNGGSGMTPGPAIDPTIQPFDVPGSIAIDDFDNDGDVDFVVADQDDDFVGDYVLMSNDGLAGFTPIVLEPPGPTNGDLEGRAVAADVNGDGWSDLILSSLDTGLWSGAILLRNPDGVLFQPAFEQVARPFDAGDIDGDGDVDLVDGTFDRTNEPLDRVIANRSLEGLTPGSRVQVGDSDPGSGGAHPVLGATGPFRTGQRLEIRLSGAAPGVTGRLIVRQVAAEAATGGGNLPGSFGAVSLGARVIDFVTSGAPTDPVGTGSWTHRRRITADDAGRTLRFEVELDDAGGAGGLVKTNQLYVAFAEELN